MLRCTKRNAAKGALKCCKAVTYKTKPEYYLRFFDGFADMNGKTKDLFEFCLASEEATGSIAIKDLNRLSAELVANEGELVWTMSGGRHAIGAPELKLHIEAQVQLICQRCLTPYVESLNTVSTLVLAKSEEQADELEERLDDDSIDVIVVSSEQDYWVLLEDEALLALPVSPRHATCPAGFKPEIVQEKGESPFAALKKLK